MEIIHFNESHYNQIAGIYLEGINTGIATFEDKVPEWDIWDKNHIKSCRLAIRSEGNIVAWAALSFVSSRNAYAGVAEVSIYVSTKYRKQGLGSLLLNKLIEESQINNFWTLQSSIFEENINSIKLHQKCGFRVVGVRYKIAKKNGIWKNTVIMERRSFVIL